MTSHRTLGMCHRSINPVWITILFSFYLARVPIQTPLLGRISTVDCIGIFTYGRVMMAENIVPMSQKLDKRESCHRKNNKPLMEKRRRARINSCLSQLKGLVLQAMKKDSSQFSKLEKADILELTVKHLRVLQRHHLSSAVNVDPTAATKYRAGYSECANEVVRFLRSAQGVEDDVRGKLVNHLVGRLHTPTQTSVPVQTTSPHHSTGSARPLQVQIPTSQCVQNQYPSLLLPAGLSSVSQHKQTTPVSGALQGHVYCVPVASPSGGSSNLSGAFQLIPGDSDNGSVAVYLGQTSGNNGQRSSPAVPIYSVQVPQTIANVPEVQNVSHPTSQRYDNMNECVSPQNTVPFVKEEMYKLPQYTSISPACSPVSRCLDDQQLWRPW